MSATAAPTLDPFIAASALDQLLDPALPLPIQRLVFQLESQKSTLAGQISSVVFHRDPQADLRAHEFFAFLIARIDRRFSAGMIAEGGVGQFIDGRGGSGFQDTL